MSYLIELTVEETVLGILHGRSWGMYYEQIANDPAWNYVKDGNRGERDYPTGQPTTRTLDLAILHLVERQMVDRIFEAPPIYRLRRIAYNEAHMIATQLQLACGR